MTPNQARQVRQQGHDDEERFANLIGLTSYYAYDPKGKTDLIDKNGDAHSIKSGKKKWQIFLYGRSRFENDPHFRDMDGIGAILINCIDAFPENIDDYKENKPLFKSRLRPHMRALRSKLEDKGRLSAFFEKAMFNADEVKYLTILHDEQFHVFHRQDVIHVLATQISVKKLTSTQPQPDL